MNIEALEIRQEIERLKERLREISKQSLQEEESLFVCTSSFCGHDEILDSLKAWCKQMDVNERCVIAGYNHNNREKNFSFYSTTITPDILPKVLKNKESMIEYYKKLMDVDIINILEFLCYKVILATLEELSLKLKCSEDSLKEKIQTLLKCGFIENKEGILKVTALGWQFYCVAGHIYYNNAEKVPIEKAQFFIEFMRDNFGLEIGNSLEFSTSEYIDKIKKSHVFNKIQEKHITLEDIEKMLFQYYRNKY
ncbi:hypothetical protein [Haloimpatiens massiliensis]|uniref:hypothetical protein n=1 Tax=Haloimpatiens massiliensis TaxID=1658110 RepID=UPI000C81D582|nr:hypothetical protein [Haloimpatiens massiliensis]